MTLIFTTIKNYVILWAFVRAIQGLLIFLNGMRKLFWTTFIKKEYHS